MDRQKLLQILIAEHPELAQIYQQRQTADLMKELITVTKKGNEDAFKNVAYLKGEKGDQGERGMQGEKGEQGERGEQGAQGERGEDGASGKDGTPGEDGMSGEKGDKGDNGSPDIAEDIASKLNTLESILNYSVIKDAPNFDAFAKEFKRGGKYQIDLNDVAGAPLDQRWHGGGLSSVSHDSTLTGNGTPSSPLHVVSSGGTPGGSNTQVQFNDSGSFGGDAGFVYNKLSNTINLTGNVEVVGLLYTETALVIKETSAGSDAIAIRAPSSIAAGFTLTLPGDTGVANQFLQTNGTGTLTWASAVVAPAGLDTQIQFNDGGAFGGSSNFIWDKSTNLLGVGGQVIVTNPIGGSIWLNVDPLNQLFDTGDISDIGNGTRFTADDVLGTIALNAVNGYSFTGGAVNFFGGGGININDGGQLTMSSGGTFYETVTNSIIMYPWLRLLIGVSQTPLDWSNTVNSSAGISFDSSNNVYIGTGLQFYTDNLNATTTNTEFITNFGNTNGLMYDNANVWTMLSTIDFDGHGINNMGNLVFNGSSIINMNGNDIDNVGFLTSASTNNPALTLAQRFAYDTDGSTAVIQWGQGDGSVILGGGSSMVIYNSGAALFSGGNASITAAGVFQSLALTASKPVFTDASQNLVSGLFSLSQIVASGNLLAQSATVTSVATYTTPNDSTTHSFRVGAYTAITAISAGTLTVQVSFTDENNTAQTISFFPMGLTSAGLTTTGFTAFETANIRVKANTAITLKTTFTGVSITYDVGGTIESLY